MYGFSAYSGSKFALRAFAEVLQQELEDSGPKVTIVYPPDMDTPGFAVMLRFIEFLNSY